MPLSFCERRLYLCLINQNVLSVALIALSKMQGEERKAIVWMMSAIGEIYGEKW